MADYATRDAAALEQTGVPNLEESQPPVGKSDAIGTRAFDYSVLEVPLVLDGEVVDDPTQLNNLGPARLHFTPLRHERGVALGAFTRRDDMLSAAHGSHRSLDILASLPLGDARALCTNPSNLSEFACFFEHMHFGGDRICLGPRLGFPDLTQGGWNDVISSVDWCRWEISLFEHIHFQGNELLIASGCDAPYLAALGWNDRASSAVNWGRPF